MTTGPGLAQALAEALVAGEAEPAPPQATASQRAVPASAAAPSPTQAAPAAPSAPKASAAPEGPATVACEKCKQAFVVLYEALPDEGLERVPVACPHCWSLNQVLVGSEAAANTDYRAEKA